MQLEKQEEFYLVGQLSNKKQAVLDKILNTPDKKLQGYGKRIQEAATYRGKKSVDITLMNAQIKPMLMSLVTKRFFIGDKPGLGKTVMSAASYANYQYNMLKRGQTPKKIIVVTTSAHVTGFSNEWSSYGINLLPLLDGSVKIERALKNTDLTEYDGIIINWDGLKTNGFLDRKSTRLNSSHVAISYAVFCLKKKKTKSPAGRRAGGKPAAAAAGRRRSRAPRRRRGRRSTAARRR